MPVIKLQTIINAPVKVVFDLSRSIDLHKISTAHTREEAIAGTTSGLIGPDETVTWRAKHFGLMQLLTSKITEFESPYRFTNEMVSGAFARFEHQHIFSEEDGYVVMTDVFDYTSHFGLLGRMADVLFLKRYMAKLLTERNRVIKEYAEDDSKYNRVLHQIKTIS